MRNGLATAGRVGLIMLAWPVWMIGCAPLIATLCHAVFRLHHVVGAVAALMVPVMPGVGAAVYAVRVANAGECVTARTE